MKATKIPPQHVRFMDEYPKDLNATRSAIDAGYSKRSARQTAHRLMTIDYIQEGIAKRLEARSKRTQIDQDRVLREIAAVAFSNIYHYTIDGEGEVRVRPDAPVDAGRAIASVKRKERRGGKNDEGTTETEYHLWNKIEALRLLAMHLGMLKEVHETVSRVPPPEELVQRARAAGVDLKLDP